jgi:uncharacterized protein DUF2071
VKFPIMRGVIDRRMLVNFHADPEMVAANLPAPFRPKLVHGVAMVGICLIRLKKLRPMYMPSWFGLSSENAAHRIAVEWDERGQVREGVYVKRRDTNSRLNAIAGGRLFPGFHFHAQFSVQESNDDFNVALRSDDGVTSMSVRSHRSDELPSTSVFQSLNEASEFFQAGGLGYSSTPNPSRFQGLELRCQNWYVEPHVVREVHSSFFEDETKFPKGSIEFDSALLMRGIEHEWHSRPDLCTSHFVADKNSINGMHKHSMLVESS